MQSAKTKLGADCGSDHELLMAKFRLKLKNVEKIQTSLVAQLVKNLPVCRRSGFDPWVRKTPGGKNWQPTLVFLAGESPWTEEPGG